MSPVRANPSDVVERHWKCETLRKSPMTSIKNAKEKEMEMTNRASFLTLSKHHTELNWLFNSHQRALLAKDIGLARAQLASFRNVLKRHIEVEAASLRAIVADRDAEMEHRTVQIFQAEHEELSRHLDNLLSLSDQLHRSRDLS